MHVKFMNLLRQHTPLKQEIELAFASVMESSAFAGGSFVKIFEDEFAAAHNSSFAVCVNSGTAALHATLQALSIGPGDEVIVPCNTFIATAEAVSLVHATPVFCDVSLDDYTLSVDDLDRCLTSKTRAIIAVHLYGQMAKMQKIKEYADKHGLLLIEDACQAHNARGVAQYGVAACFSFYPGKNLGAMGEGGAVLTQNEVLAKKIMAIRNHGSLVQYEHQCVGHNYRMDGIQAAILSVKLKHLSTWTQKRQKIAEKYCTLLRSLSEVILPLPRSDTDHVYHLFVIRVQKRQDLQNFLRSRSIETHIHYPIPCHLQAAYHSLGYKSGSLKNGELLAKEILSLPLYPDLEAEEVEYVASSLREFYESHS